MLPSTILYYKACVDDFPNLLRTTELAQSTSQYYFVLQSLRKPHPTTTSYYTACAWRVSHLFFTHCKLLHKEACTQIVVYAETLLHRQKSTHRSFYTMSFHTQKLFTHRSFYTQQAFTHSKLLRIKIADNSAAQPRCSQPNMIHDSLMQPAQGDPQTLSCKPPYRMP